jgi:DNA-directed RNA polymerase subunit RPC12/RpoP
MAVKGDFEITVSYEILNEPDSAEAGFPHTRITLDVAVDKANHVEATLSRRVSKWGGTEFLTWVRRHEDGKDKSNYKEFPARSKTGKLRLARAGATVAFYAADGPDGLFTLLLRYPFNSDPLEGIRIVGSTGSPKSALDVRVSDLHVRAESLQITTDSISLPTGVEGWLVIGLALVLMTAVVVGSVVAFWHVRRVQKAPVLAVPSEPASIDPAPAPFSFPCSHCGKKLRAKAEMSGKNVKCPECGKSVRVMAPPGPLGTSHV